MRKKPVSLGLAMPCCRYCGRTWRPPEGVSAEQAYCSRCKKSRQLTATVALSLRAIKPKELGSFPYLLPRHLRNPR